MQISIRDATDDDLTAIVELGVQIQQMHVDAHEDIFSVPVAADLRAFYAPLIADDTHTFLVAERDSQVVGMLMWKFKNHTQPIKKPGRSLSVEHLVVDQAVQGQGVGKALMAHVTQAARDADCDAIVLTHWDFNEGAAAFYDGLGFATTMHARRLAL